MAYIEVVHEPIKHPIPTAPPETTFQILFSLKGRIRRKTYWIYGFTFLFLLGIPMLILYGYVMSGELDQSEFAKPLVLLGFLLLLVSIWICFFALPIKRLHDTNHTGFWCIVDFICPIPIVHLHLMFKDGTLGQNDYGLDPKQR